MEESAPQSTNKSSASKFLIPIAVIIIVIGIIMFATTNRKDEAVVSNKTEETYTTTEDTTQSPSDSDDTPPSTSAGTFKDGTYSSDGKYVSPGGEEKIGVTVTLADGIITDAQVETKATRPNTVRYQGMFAENFKPLVVGKKITDVELSRVSGSSLTSGGFNDALEKIKSQAKS
ncbi:MAG TPA: hypothetical protein VM077_04310 [Candidatus Limnocylindrales bacterium]|nr:hypothetical protein [Candidatus Limnocylindrales bacterium]